MKTKIFFTHFTQLFFDAGIKQHGAKRNVV